jgi:hypothetical protein
LKELMKDRAGFWKIICLQALEVGQKELSEELAERLQAVLADSSAKLEALERKGGVFRAYKGGMDVVKREPCTEGWA